MSPVIGNQFGNNASEYYEAFPVLGLRHSSSDPAEFKEHDSFLGGSRMSFDANASPNLFQDPNRSFIQGSGAHLHSLDASDSLSRKNYLTTRMIESLKNKRALKLHGGRMVYGHVYNHNDHTHIHGHVHNNKAENCQLDLSDSLPKSETRGNGASWKTPNSYNNPDFDSLQDFEPQLVTICCDKDHKQSSTLDSNVISNNIEPFIPPEDKRSQPNTEPNTEPPNVNHHLHQCTASELDLMNSCFDFDFCDNVSCNDFVCDEFLHSTSHGDHHDHNLASKNSKQPIINDTKEPFDQSFNCPLFYNLHNHEPSQIDSTMNNLSLNSSVRDTVLGTSVNTPVAKEEQPDSIHDRFILNPETNEVLCVSCNNDCSMANTNVDSFGYWDSQQVSSGLKNTALPGFNQFIHNLGQKNKSIKKNRTTGKIIKSRQNNPGICKWDNCKTSIDPHYFKKHIIKDHLVPSYNGNGISDNLEFQKILLAVPNLGDSPININPVNSHHMNDFECEWSNCTYQSNDLFSLFNHVNENHAPLLEEALTKEFGSTSDFSTLSASSALETPSPTAFSDLISGQGDLDLGLAQNVCCWTHNGTTCNKRFVDTTELTNHIIEDHVGSGKSNYVCQWKDCDRHGRIFNQRQKIVRHLHVHTKHKPFKCEECGHCFSVETMLMQHKRVHSGEKPFVCKVCNKRFATSSSLSIHVRTHTGEKPLECKYPGCNKRFSESSNLAKHMKIHEKQFKCTKCTKSFDKHQQLQNHMLKHQKQELRQASSKSL